MTREYVENIVAENRIDKVRIIEMNKPVIGGQPSDNEDEFTSSDGLRDLACTTQYALDEIERVENNIPVIPTIPKVLDDFGNSTTDAGSQRTINVVKKKADQIPDPIKDKLVIGQDVNNYLLIGIDELTKLLSYAQVTGWNGNIAMSQSAVTSSLINKTAAFGVEQSTPTYSLYQTFGDNMAAALTTVPGNCHVTGAYSEKWPAAAVRYVPVIRKGGAI